jgi:hypothetical protein
MEPTTYECVYDRCDYKFNVPFSDNDSKAAELRKLLNLPPGASLESVEECACGSPLAVHGRASPSGAPDTLGPYDRALLQQVAIRRLRARYPVLQGEKYVTLAELLAKRIATRCRQPELFGLDVDYRVAEFVAELRARPALAAGLAELIAGLAP